MDRLAAWDNRAATSVRVTGTRFTRVMTNSDRIWLEVSYEEQNAAKAAGARWDRGLRAWYAPRPGITADHRCLTCWRVRIVRSAVTAC